MSGGGDGGGTTAIVDLVARAKDGSSEAFASIYELLARPVAGYLRSRGVLDVEDLTSEVFISVFTGMARFEGDAEGFRSWVFTIAHRRSVDGWRKAARTPATTELDGEDGAWVPSAEDLAIGQIGDARALALLDTLSPDQRDVLLLRIVGDLTVEQAATVLDKTPGAVKALQHRGLARLRRLLTPEGVTK
jgi:RNA polymerase sigma-70 factor (ECF subfamily)